MFLEVPNNDLAVLLQPDGSLYIYHFEYLIPSYSA